MFSTICSAFIYFTFILLYVALSTQLTVCQPAAVFMQDLLCSLCSLWTLKPYYALLTLSPLNCAFLCYSLTHRVELNVCALPAPRWLLGAWWIQRNPVIHTSVNMHARWRSDLKKGYVLQRLWSECIRSLFPFLSSSSPQNIISLFLFVFFLSFCASLLFSLCLSLSLCLGATLRFQSWRELENSPAALRFLLVIPSKGIWRHTHFHTHQTWKTRARD